MAKASLKEAVQAVGLEEEEALAKPIPASAPRQATSAYPCVLKPTERAAAGMRRWRIRAALKDQTSAVLYVQASNEQEAKAEYLKRLGQGTDVDVPSLVVVPLPD